MNRPIEGNNASFVTGGDVSRFQRRTMPVAAPAGGAPSMSAPVQASQMTMNGTPAPRGPVVRITRGKDTEAVSVGAK